MPHARGVTFARFRVAVVAVAAGVILALVVYLLTGGTLFQEKATLYLYMPDATGVDIGTAVRVNGTSVGKVAAVGFSGSNQPDRIVRLTLKVELEHLRDMPADSWAQISSATAVGNKYVDITQGKSAAYLQAGSEVQYRPQPQLLKTLDLQQFANQLRSADATLTDIEQGKSKVGQLIVGRQMYDDLRKALAQADRGFRDAIGVTTGVGGLLYTDKIYRQISDPLIRLDSQLRRIDSGQSEMGRLLREDGTYLKLREQAAGLRRSIVDLRATPFMTSDGMYQDWSRALASLVNDMDQINRGMILNTSFTYDDLAGLAGELKAGFRDFRKDPKKYLRVDLF